MKLQEVTKSYKRLQEVTGPRRKPAYEDLKFYQDIRTLRRLTYQITERFNKTHMRLVSQMRDAARSAKQNILEGYKKGTIGEFIHSIKISQGSLAELSGDIEDCREDGLINDEEFTTLSSLLNSAQYLSSRYLDSLYRIKEEGTWRTPGGAKAKT